MGYGSSFNGASVTTAASMVKAVWFERGRELEDPWILLVEEKDGWNRHVCMSVPKFELVSDVLEESRCLCRDTRVRSFVRGPMNGSAGVIDDVSDIASVVEFDHGPRAHYHTINNNVVM
jgi:hypothetical protein